MLLCWRKSGPNAWSHLRLILSYGVTYLSGTRLGKGGAQMKTLLLITCTLLGSVIAVPYAAAQLTVGGGAANLPTPQGTIGATGPNVGGAVSSITPGNYGPGNAGPGAVGPGRLGPGAYGLGNMGPGAYIGGGAGPADIGVDGTDGR